MCEDTIQDIEDIFQDPTVLMRKTPEDIQLLVVNQPFWFVSSLGRGSHKGQGLVLREVTIEGQLTGRRIQWHPGGGHHGPDPYWKVSSPEGGTVRIGPQFELT